MLWRVLTGDGAHEPKRVWPPLARSFKLFEHHENAPASAEGGTLNHSVKLGEFVWIVSVDDDEPLAIVMLGHDEPDEGEPTIWFELEADAAQDMGGALIRAYGVLMRRAHALPQLDTDLDDDR